MKTFDDIFEQDEAVATLRRAWAADRLPHALLFVGPVGVGKRLCADALAGLFLCHQPQGDRPCGRCESCTLYAAGNHPDCRVIYRQLVRYHDKTGKSKATELTVPVIRGELVEPAGMRPVMGHGRVFVVEEADSMNVASQNAMLKTLEEPYGRSLIILLTDQPTALLPTIRSRCQLVRFRPLPGERVRSELQARGIDAAAAQQAARFAGGSLGVALQWLDAGVISSADKLESSLQELLTDGNGGELDVFLKSSAEAYAERQLEHDPLTSKEFETRQGLLIYLKIAAAVLRQRLSETADPAQLERICRGIDSLLRSEIYVGSNVNIPLIVQQLSQALERELAPHSAP